MAGDPARLADRRVRGGPGRSRLPAGLHRRRALVRAASRSAPSSAPGSVRCCCRGLVLAYAPAFGLLGALLGGAILASGLEGIGFRLRRTLDPARARACSTARSARCSARRWRSAIVWIARGGRGADARAHGKLRADIQRSAILRKLNEVLPPSGPILDALARLDPLPSITGPSPDVARAARRRSRARPACAARRAASCACSAPPAAWRSRARAGSPRPDLVVTNAHVVAGEQDTTRRGRRERARACRPRRSPSTPPTTSRCCASRARRCRRCARAAPASGTAGAILGYPENGPLRRRAGAHRAHADGGHPGRLRAAARSRAC